ncbi:copper resistance system multicopper oxidase [Pistricoccus aurantiacus]|uniref:Copper resistance system multicopper oxidase n=1 Tax=Pistricoccus aurantiacus TaxID=1883414 RepID=A0A5B8SR82_9GAMM|nr:copper resistance system multicopper oxidase [Pistricoccus aurantiacus]QEA37643.1 copper resistance system multicopper oxidase [Pistricoccus aurantiacus]
MTDTPHHQERRRLLQAMAATGLLAGLETFLPGYARAGAGAERHLAGDARVPGGRPRSVTQDFYIRREGIGIAGGHAPSAITINHSIPGPLLELWEGHEARLRVHNLMNESTSIHWHGILLPFQMDGVPGVAFPGIQPGDSFEARFPVRQYGTYWYHSHTGLQEQIGQTGPIVIHPAEPDSIQADRDYVVVLNDWTFEDPARVMAQLKKMSGYYNFNKRTVEDFVEDVARSGWAKTLKDRQAWGKMRMNPRGIADVTGHTYSYLMNGLHPEANWNALFRPGERIRLRVINASSMTYFNFRIPGLPLTVVAADGPSIEPVETDEFQIGVAETYDIVVEPREDKAYTLMAESMDRSGYARGTLAPRLGMSAPVPALRAQPQRTLVDMGMKRNMLIMGPGKKPNTRLEGDSVAIKEAAGPVVAQHGPDHHGAGNATIAKVQRRRLGERGAGLEDVAHRVLTYSQLRSIEPMSDKRAPTHTVELHLTGNMNSYMWSFDGVEYSDSKVIDFPYGERVRLIMVNDTMMEHPMHLHGMFMELENGQGEHLPKKHTISVRAGERVSLLISAVEPGRWAFHCHLLYHLERGMFRVVRVSNLPGADNA